VKKGGGLLIAGQALSWSDNENLLANGFPGNKVLAEMGIVIGSWDDSNKVFRVSPIPSPEYNVLSALQIALNGSQKLSSIATSTLYRAAKFVVNEATCTTPLFKPLHELADSVVRSMDANLNKMAHSKLTSLLIKCWLSKVNYLTNYMKA